MSETFFVVTGDQPQCKRVELEPSSEGRYWTPGPLIGGCVCGEFRPQADGYERTEALAWAAALTASEAKAHQLNKDWNAEQERSDVIRREWYRVMAADREREAPSGTAPQGRSRERSEG